MATEQSEGCPFKSLRGGGWLNSGQYLAEGVLLRQAAFKKEALPHGFWNMVKWKREFLSQLRFANALLKLYPIGVILKVLRSPDGKRAFSLGAKWLDPLFKAELQKEEARRKVIEESPPPPVECFPAQPPRPPQPTSKSTLSKLREL